MGNLSAGIDNMAEGDWSNSGRFVCFFVVYHGSSVEESDIFKINDDED